MRKQTLVLTFLGLVALFLSACQTWFPGGTSFTSKDQAFTLQAPSDWMYTTRLGCDFAATREGLILQEILVEHRELKDALKNSKRELTASLAPFEVAEAFVDDLRSDHTLLSLEIKSNTPATIGGQPGFHLVYSFHTNDKLRLTEECYGCVVNNRLWLVRYRAPTRHYFELGRHVFADTVKTFQFGKS